MKAIETHYRGHKFRSRLEARYAVFFDAMQIKWKYEIEGFVLSNGQCYLPDFWLPEFNLGTWVEVKPEPLTPEERENCRLLCLESKFNVWLAVDTPDIRCYEVFYSIGDDVLEGDGIPNADQAEHENRMFGMSAYGTPGELVNPEYRDLLGDTLKYAVKAAKEARFEHGEQP